MTAKTRSIHQIVEEQAQRWQRLHQEKKTADKRFPTVTLSREPGSGGSHVARRLSEVLDLDFFHQEIIQEIAQSAHVSRLILETLDEKGLSMLEDWVSAAILDHHLWPDEYLHHLMKVIGTIGRHGKAVIVGRGANFILPKERRFAVRVIAPIEDRVKNVCHHFGVEEDVARRRILRTESDRKAFVRKYFYTDIAAPEHYELVINTGVVGVDGTVKTIRSALGY